MDRSLLTLNDPQTAGSKVTGKASQTAKYWKYVSPIFGYLTVLLVGVMLGHFGDSLVARHETAASNRASVELNRPKRKYGEGHEMFDEEITIGNAYELSRFQVFGNHSLVPDKTDGAVFAFRHLYGGLLTNVDYNHMDMNGHYKDDSQNWVAHKASHTISGEGEDGFLFESLQYRGHFMCAKNEDLDAQVMLMPKHTIHDDATWQRLCIWKFEYDAECVKDSTSFGQPKVQEVGKDYKRLYFHLRLKYSLNQCIHPIHDYVDTDEVFCYACDSQVVLRNCTGCLAGFMMEYYESESNLEERLEALAVTQKAIEHEKGIYAQNMRRERRKDREDAKKAQNRPNSWKYDNGVETLKTDTHGSKPLKHGLPGDGEARPWHMDEEDEEVQANVIHVVVEED